MPKNKGLRPGPSENPARLAWKFIGKDHRLRFQDKRRLIPGETLRDPMDNDGRVIATPVLCESGFHASLRPLDALGFADADMTHIARVEVGGVVVEGEDKIAGTELRCLWIADAERTMHEFAAWCGWRALETLGTDAPLASILALQVKEAWLAGEADDEDLNAAWDAAAREAAARAAAWYAARAAAAWAAACAAARAAAWYAAWAAQNKELERRLLALEAPSTPTGPTGPKAFGADAPATTVPAAGEDGAR